MSGYRLCTATEHQGPRWQPVTSFRVREWLPGKTEPLYIASECDACHRIKGRASYSRRRQEACFVERKRETERFSYRKRTEGQVERRNIAVELGPDDKLDPVPFCDWLRQMVQEVGVGNVAASIGVGADLITRLVSGRHQQEAVKRSRVEQYMTAFGQRSTDIYP